MTSTPHNNHVKPNTSQKPPNIVQPTKEDIKSFNSLFKHSQSNKPSTSQSESSQQSNQKNHASTIEFSSKQSLNDLLHDTGINTLHQINQLLIAIVSKIKAAPPSGPIQYQFDCMFTDHTFNLQINISTKNNIKTIKISTSPELLQLISQNIPQLKKQLKKQSILFDEIELDDILNQKKTTKNLSENNPSKNLNKTNH